ncbi:MAG: HAMP domain-containing sensor histidine kinase [Anaerolineales bacterium]|nr:MAG: HAMP domain-containing sensor histidine kinase [Anaerolineales bacterium]
MFRSLNTRLLLSYIAVILVCLVLVGLGLLLFARPAWTRSVQQDLQRALQATMPALRRASQSGEIEPLLSSAAEDQEVRILLVDALGNVRFDTEETWIGQQIDELAGVQGGSGRIVGTFDGPVGPVAGQWVYVGQLAATPERPRVTVVFASQHQRLLALTWFAEYLLPPLVRAGAVALVLSILLALLVSRSVGRPLRRVSGAALAIALGESGTRAPVSGPTEVQNLAQSFNSMADQVEAAQRSQRDFVANVSHELKTPLTAVQGFAQALFDGTASDPQAMERAGRVIHGEAERMRRLVDDLLVLARFDGGQMVLRSDRVELAPLLRACLERLEPQAKAADVALALSVPDRLFVTGDADRLGQVFTNLLDNGIRHTPAGGRVMAEAQLGPGANMVEITVTDAGEGIAGDELSRIFERFYQVDKARPRSRGAGLGLAIVREIVQAHDGEVSVESVVGLGSKFLVTLPARPGDASTTAVKRRRQT